MSYISTLGNGLGVLPVFVQIAMYIVILSNQRSSSHICEFNNATNLAKVIESSDHDAAQNRIDHDITLFGHVATYNVELISLNASPITQ